MHQLKLRVKQDSFTEAQLVQFGRVFRSLFSESSEEAKENAPF